MTIQVTSNQPEVQAAAPVEQPPSAPAENQPEQNPSPESDPEETEAEEAKDESEDESAQSEESNDAEKDKPKKKSGYQRRIDKLNARYSEERKAREALEHRLAQLERSGEPKGEKVEAKAPTDGEPNPDDFENHSDYVKAVIRWDREQADKTAKAEAEKQRLEREHAELHKSHFDREKSFAEKHDDYLDVISEIAEIPISAAFEHIIVSSENGPELMYELAKNPKEFERLAALNPIALAREIGRIESRLTKAAEPPKVEPKKLTQAPKPIDPVGGSKGSVQKSLSDPSLTQAEYEAIRRKQIAARKAW
jgi:Arc/MetJ-type ribon-helix-helix transcriptional regulator